MFTSIFALSIIDAAWNFFAPGGVFMVLLILCSLIGIGAILFKLFTLKKADVVPEVLADAVVHGRAEVGEEEARGSVLGRLCYQAERFDSAMSPAEKRQAVEVLAREEIVALQSGIPLLEIVITIAPLLGILGTASGLVQVFGNFSDVNSQEAVADGIGRALSTTIVGLAVAVPAVIAQVSFTRKIERLAARLEVLMETFMNHLNRSDEAATPPPMPEEA